MLTPGVHRFKRGPGELFVVAHLEELRRGEEVLDRSASSGAVPPRLTLLIVKRRAPAGAAWPNREISRFSGTTLCLTVSVPSGWSNTSVAAACASRAT